MEDIALVGIALKCSGASNIDEFLHLLRNKEVHTKTIGKERVQYSKVLNSENLSKFGYLDRVDLFDYEFFKISKKEADAINPGHRLLLQVVCEAVENSGFSLSDIRNKTTGLFITTNINHYNFLYQSTNAELDFIGGVPSMSAGRIARFLDIRGPVVNIDTACSASLVAICEAERRLKSGEIDLAIVGGSRILCAFDDVNSAQNSSILSPDGLCKAFDDTADGTSGGEGVAAVLLKRLKDAEKDNNTIRCLIKGSSINHNGELSTGLTAPNPVSQSTLINSAAKNAAVKLETVEYLETHGTGTKLGDPIEYKAICDAFNKEDSQPKVRLGTLKPNIGHLDNMSGMFGFIKASLALSEKEFFPLANFNKLNKFVNPHPNIITKKEGEFWETNYKNRRAGVSSFGLSGTNAHVILEEYAQGESLGLDEKQSWLKLSAKTKEGLKTYAESIIKEIATSKYSLQDICRTLNRGRGDYSYRFSVYGENKEATIAAIKEQLENIDKLESNTGEHNITYLLLSDKIDSCFFDELKNEKFLEIYNNILERLKAYEKGDFEIEIFQTALYKYINDKGLNINYVLCNGTHAVNSKNIINEKYEFTTPDSAETVSINWERLKSFLEKNSYSVLLVVGSSIDKLTKLKELTDSLNISLIHLQNELAKSENNFWCALYNNHVSFNWEAFYDNEVYKKVPFCTYPFQNKSCWNTSVNPLIPQTAQISSESSNGAISTNGINGNALNPLNNIKETVVGFLKETLQAESISLEDDFFEIGGNSIVGVQFINRINSTYNISLEFDQLYDCYEVSDIITLIDGMVLKDDSPQNKNQDAILEESATEFPLINSQNRIWSESQNIESSISYNINFNLKINGELHIDKLEKALLQIILTNDNFRLRFKIKEDGERIYQEFVSSAASTFELEQIQISEESQIIEKINSIYNLPFDLEIAPLFRATLIQKQAHEYILVFSFHHIIFDGWSFGIFLKLMVDNYLHLINNKEIISNTKNSQYIDYIQWTLKNISNNKLEPHKIYWNEKFNGEENKFIYGDQNTDSSNLGKKIRVIINNEIKNLLKDLALKNRTTLFTVLLSCVRTYLYKLANSNVVIGTPISGRTQKDFENVIGLFLNTLPLKTTLYENLTFMDCLALEKDTVLQALKHELYPYDHIIKDLRLKGAKVDSLYNVMVVLQNQNNRSGLEFQPTKDLPIAIQRGYEIEEKYSNLDITFMFFDNEDTLELELDYNIDAFGSNTIDSFLNNFLHYLKNVCKDESKSIKNVEYIHPPELEQLVHNFNNTQTANINNQTVIDLFIEKVNTCPQATALCIGNKKYSYKDLDELSNQFSNFLLNEKEIKTNDIVTISLKRSEWFIVFIIGILKTGSCYIPLDPNYPEDRKKYIYEDSQSSLNIENSILKEFTQNIDKYNKAYKSKASHNKLAYIIYTSGSTGRPKGVEIDHKALTNYIKSSKELFISNKEDSFAFFTSISFDLTVTSIYTPLINGNSIIVYEDDLSDVLIKKILEDDKASIIKLTPSHLKMIRDNSNIEISNKLRTFIVGGEEFETALAKQITDKFNGNVILLNEYGPTEATVGCMIYKYKGDEQSKSLSIGLPINNTQIYLLDNDLNPVGIGVKGEIFIGGIGLAKGYHNRPELTQEKFIDNPFIKGQKMYKTEDLAVRLPDGNLIYKGRKDDQVKINGYRVELGEVESTIVELKEYVRDAAVIIKEHNDIKNIVAYIIPTIEKDKNELKQLIKHKIENVLPGYMYPKYFVVMDSFPLTVNGKVDKSKLPDIQETDIIKQKYIAPITETEVALTKIWEDKLQLDQIGLFDDFFDLGGDSLLAVRLLAKINADFETNYPLDILFHVGNIKQLSEYIDNGYTFNQDYYLMGSADSDQKIFAFPPILGYGTAYQNIFKGHEASVIAFNFLEEEKDLLDFYAQVIQEHQPYGALTFFGMSAGGNLAYTVAKHLIENYDRKIEHIVMFDSFAITEKDWREKDFDHMYEFVKYDMGLEGLMDNASILRKAKKKLYSFFEFHNDICSYNESIDAKLSLVKAHNNDFKYNWNNIFSMLEIYQGNGEHFDMLQEPHLKHNKKILWNILKKVIA